MKKIVFLILTFIYLSLLTNAQNTAPTFKELKEKLSKNLPVTELYQSVPNLTYTGGMIVESDTVRNLYKLAFSKKTGDIAGPSQNADGTCSILKVVSKGETYLMRVSYIWLDKKSASENILENKADSILSALNNGADFSSLAQTISMDGNAAKGGDLGWFETGTMDKQFEDAIRIHKKGDFFKVKVDQFGWYIILVTADQGIKKYIGRLEITKSNCD